MRMKRQQNMRSSRSMQKKPFDPDSFVEDIDRSEGILDGISTYDLDAIARATPRVKKVNQKRPCHKCGSTTYTRLRYDREALGFRRDSAIGCSKCVK